MNVIDRRLNPKKKSLGNRQRFVRRAKADIREAVKDAIKKRKVSEVEGSEQIRIRSKGVGEPTFGHGRDSGIRDAVLPGNKDFNVGDVIPKPQGGGGGRGGKASADGEGDDDFVFTLSKDEFLDLFFEDLKLPNLVKTKLKDVKSFVPMRAGYTSDGPPAKLNRVRTMRRSIARRIALKRPKTEDVEELERLLAAARAEVPQDEEKIRSLETRLRHIQQLRRVIAYVDPLDLQYNRTEKRPKPATQAVMFCLMDASASMTEPLKDLAKRFFMLLHVFLSRHYKEVDIVFVRHTSTASEVDEDTFFRGVETGGTVISTALEEMDRIVKDRYSPADWNIYAAQASDGDNIPDDMGHCMELLTEKLLPACQYYAYIEVSERPGPGETVVWQGYKDVAEAAEHFAMRRVSNPGEIFPVFHDLFSEQG
ncbi:MAG TPA: YeaH/YhbH family protein [Hyphomicrobiaceae bacterium]|nr:YeaH/YhbH family protein [Hyphomicrobiaceae bacterium]